MKLEGTKEFDASREVVWSVINDPAKMAKKYAATPVIGSRSLTGSYSGRFLSRASLTCVCVPPRRSV